MPQLDTSTFAGQIFWLFVFFGLLLLISSKITLPKLDKKLRVRHQVIDDAQQTAIKLQFDIDKTMAEYTDKLNEAQQTNQLLIAKTMSDINQQEAQHKESLKREYKKRLDEFTAKIIQQETVLSADIASIATTSALQVLHHLGQKTLTKQHVTEIVLQTLNNEQHHV